MSLRRLPARRLSRLEAIRAVHGLVAPGLEWHARFVAAAGAGGGEHLALRSGVTAAAASTKSTAALSTAFCTATRTALRILITAFPMELLVIGAERERVTALHAGQFSVCIHQGFQLLPC